MRSELRERIEAAIARTEEFNFGGDTPAAVLRDCAAEIERLSMRAENDADHARSLMAENERLTGERDGWQEWHHRATRERDALKARVAELEARTAPTTEKQPAKRPRRHGRLKGA